MAKLNNVTNLSSIYNYQIVYLNKNKTYRLIVQYACFNLAHQLFMLKKHVSITYIEIKENRTIEISMELNRRLHYC